MTVPAQNLSNKRRTLTLSNHWAVRGLARARGGAKAARHCSQPFPSYMAVKPEGDTFNVLCAIYSLYISRKRKLQSPLCAPQGCTKGKWLTIELQGRCLPLTLVITDSARVESKLDTAGGAATRPTVGHSHNQQANSTTETKR